MKRISLFLMLFFWLVSRHLGYCLDWKPLHEQADRQSLQGAQDRLKNNPDSLDNMYLLGLVYLNLHKDKQAEEIFRKILRIAPETEAAKCGLAEVMRRGHDLKQSEALINETLESNPRFFPAYVSLAYIKYSRKDFKAAIALAGQALRHRDMVDSPNLARAYLIIAGAKGTLASNGGLVSKVSNGLSVMGYIRKAEKIKPNFPAVYFGLGSYYLLAPAFAGGNINKAEEYFEKTIKADPLFADAYARLAQVYQRRGDRKKCGYFIAKALEIDPRNDLATELFAQELSKSIKAQDFLGIFP